MERLNNCNNFCKVNKHKQVKDRLKDGNICASYYFNDEADDNISKIKHNIIIEYALTGDDLCFKRIDNEKFSSTYKISTKNQIHNKAARLLSGFGIDNGKNVDTEIDYDRMFIKNNLIEIHSDTIFNKFMVDSNIAVSTTHIVSLKKKVEEYKKNITVENDEVIINKLAMLAFLSKCRE